MTWNLEAGRRAAHVLLDATVVFREGSSDAENAAVIDLALDELSASGAVSATYDDNTGGVKVDASDLLGGCLVVLTSLVQRAAQCERRASQEVIADTRLIIDRSLPTESG